MSVLWDFLHFRLLQDTWKSQTGYYVKWKLKIPSSPGFPRHSSHVTAPGTARVSDSAFSWPHTFCSLTNYCCWLTLRVSEEYNAINDWFLSKISVIRFGVNINKAFLEKLSRLTFSHVSISSYCALFPGCLKGGDIVISGHKILTQKICLSEKYRHCNSPGLFPGPADTRGTLPPWGRPPRAAWAGRCRCPASGCCDCGGCRWWPPWGSGPQGSRTSESGRGHQHGHRWRHPPWQCWKGEM